MHRFTHFVKNRFPSLLLITVLLFLAACKIDLKNEVWLNKDTSGKALISAYVEYEKVDESTDTANLFRENALKDYLEIIGKTKGATLISQDIIDNTGDDFKAVTYQVEFKFDKMATLNKVMAIKDSTAFEYKKEKKGGSVIMRPPGMSMIAKSELERQLTELIWYTISFSLILHAPSDIKESDAMVETHVDKKTSQWDFTIDDDWYNSPLESITVKY